MLFRSLGLERGREGELTVDVEQEQASDFVRERAQVLGQVQGDTTKSHGRTRNVRAGHGVHYSTAFTVREHIRSYEQVIPKSSCTSNVLPVETLVLPIEP